MSSKLELLIYYSICYHVIVSTPYTPAECLLGSSKISWLLIVFEVNFLGKITQSTPVDKVRSQRTVCGVSDNEPFA